MQMALGKRQLQYTNISAKTMEFSLSNTNIICMQWNSSLSQSGQCEINENEAYGRKQQQQQKLTKKTPGA